MRTRIRFDQPRLERALLLKVRELADGTFAVRGGHEPHKVRLFNNRPKCVCRDKKHRRPVWCKHEIAVHLFLKH